jgi:hypothetical protein
MAAFIYGARIEPLREAPAFAWMAGVKALRAQAPYPRVKMVFDDYLFRQDLDGVRRRARWRGFSKQ